MNQQSLEENPAPNAVKVMPRSVLYRPDERRFLPQTHSSASSEKLHSQRMNSKNVLACSEEVDMRVVMHEGIPFAVELANQIIEVLLLNQWMRPESRQFSLCTVDQLLILCDATRQCLLVGKRNPVSPFPSHVQTNMTTGARHCSSDEGAMQSLW